MDHATDGTPIATSAGQVTSTRRHAMARRTNCISHDPQDDTSREKSARSSRPWRGAELCLSSQRSPVKLYAVQPRDSRISPVQGYIFHGQPHKACQSRQSSASAISAIVPECKEGRQRKAMATTRARACDHHRPLVPARERMWWHITTKLFVAFRKNGAHSVSSFRSEIAVLGRSALATQPFGLA